MSKIPSSLSFLPNVTTLSLDVCSPSSIEAAVQQVVRPSSNGSLDVLFLTHPSKQPATNSYYTSSPPYKLPKRRLEKSMGFGGVYGASKAALTTLSETLRLEVQPLVMRVVTVVTGIIETKLHENESVVELGETSFYLLEVEEYARRVVKKIEFGGVNRKIYVGPLTALFIWIKWWCPQFLWVSALVYAVSAKADVVLTE
ncbi:unnamed protein product [Zymoseptoria tritici ST99CH_3D1]|nr:unnamed protein product [Zymoseptoria tritici ST99CH_3D1]